MISKILIIDVQDAILNLSRMGTMFNVYKYFSIPEIIKFILSIKDLDADECFWWEIQNRIPIEELEKVNWDSLQIFFESALQIVDDLVRIKTNEDIDYTRYVFEKWLGSTSVILRYYTS